MRKISSVFVLLAIVAVVSVSGHHHALRRCLAGSHDIVDASHLLSETTPADQVGGDHFTRVDTRTYAANGYSKQTINTPVGLGSHMDAPSHQIQGGKTITDFTIADFISPFVMIDVRASVAFNPDYAVTVGDIQNWEYQYGRIPHGAVVGMKSGWSVKYNNETAYRNSDPVIPNRFHFPGFSDAAAQFLVTQRDIRAFASDTLSIDAGATTTYGVHKAMRDNAKYALENMDFSDPRIPADGACIIAFPAKILNVPESPVRVGILI